MLMSTTTYTEQWQDVKQARGPYWRQYTKYYCLLLFSWFWCCPLETLCPVMHISALGLVVDTTYLVLWTQSAPKCVWTSSIFSEKKNGLGQGQIRGKKTEKRSKQYFCITKLMSSEQCWWFVCWGPSLKMKRLENSRQKPGVQGWS
jgi:hypothetical protein